jgi:hypothetical protein
MEFWAFNSHFFDGVKGLNKLSDEIILVTVKSCGEDGLQDFAVVSRFLGFVEIDVISKFLILLKAIVMCGEQLFEVALVEEKQIHARLNQVRESRF